VLQVPSLPVQKQAEMLERIRQVESEYNTLKQPLYAARGRVIRRIPGFWLHCFLQHEDINPILGTVDQDILAFLYEVNTPPSLSHPPIPLQGRWSAAEARRSGAADKSPLRQQKT